jgi:HEAT repeat protein
VLSLKALVIMSLTLLALVCLLSAYTLAFKVLQRSWAGYRRKRKKKYQGGIEKALMEASVEEVTRALRPRRIGDGLIVEELLLNFIRQLKGPAFERLQHAAIRLGIVERNLKRLRSPSRFERGRALYALGELRIPEAVEPIARALGRERLDLKLVALRALAAIGDPESIPQFLEAAETLPKAMSVRLASLLLEFGAPGRKGVQTLIARNPGSFPPRVLVEILQLAAAAGEEAA